MGVKGRLEIADEGYCYAPFLSRLAAAALDLAFALAATILIYIFTFANSWYPNLGDALGVVNANDEIYRYEKDSGLFKVSSEGSLSYFEPASYEGYESPIKSYYFVYNAEGSTCPEPKKYTVKDYNVNVLELPSDSTRVVTSELFDFYTDGEGKIDENQFGIIKKSLYGEDGKLTSEAKTKLLSHFKDKYYETIDLLADSSYFSSSQNVIARGMSIIEIISVGIPFIVFYFVIPLFSKYGQTLGKRMMKLALLCSKGVSIKKYQLILRTIPFIITFGVFLFIDQFIYSISLAVIVFMVSFGCAIFTKRKKDLHDLLADTVVSRKDDAEAIELIEKKESAGEKDS